MAEVAFIGLGVMGYPMAGHLARAGHVVRVFNRTPAKAERWITEHSGTVAKTPAEAAAGAAFVFTCVGNDDDVETVTTGPDGALPAMARGAVLIDHTTASADLARRLHATADARGVGFLDAPVSGGEAGAQTGRLSIMVGGDERDFSRAEPVLAAYGRSIGLMGPSGSGQLTKMVNQICFAGVVQGLAEGLAFAKRSGLDPEHVVAVISKGAAQSWQMDNRWRTMIDGEFNFGFAVDWMRKDLAICLAEAGRNGTPLPLAQMIDGFYAEIQANGGCRWDTSSLITRLVGSTAARVAEVLAELRAMGSAQGRAGMARFGINAERALGVSMAAMRPLVRQLKRDHPLALALWATEVHEARIVAALIADPAQVTPELMDEWVAGFDSWDVCDQVCMKLFARTPYVAAKVSEWAGDEREFVRRAAFALIAGYAVAAKKAPDAAFLAFFPVIEERATDPRNFVKKAVNWALRQVGKRSVALHRPALALAERLAASDDRTARWIGRDAVKELTDPRQIARLSRWK